MFRFPTKMEDEIVGQYAAGRIKAEIARQHGISMTSVTRVLIRRGVDTGIPSYQRFHGETESGICSQYKAGSSLTSLALQHGCTPTGIRQILKRNGIERRRRGATVRQVPAPIVQDILTRFTAGESQQSIANSHGFTQTHISRVIKLHGATRQEWQKHSIRQPHCRKGGVTITELGYRMILTPDDSPFVAMRNAAGYVPEHRLVMAQHLGRCLRPDETVHHVNGDRLDNRPENLQLRNGKHGKGHAMQCADCGSRNLIPVALIEEGAGI